MTVQDRVVLHRTRPITQPDGSFVAAGLDPDQAYAVWVDDAAFMAEPVLAHPGAKPIRLTLDRQLITLDVRDTTGQALPGADIRAYGIDPSFHPTRHRVRAAWYPRDAAGRRQILSTFGWSWRIGLDQEYAVPTYIPHTAHRGAHRVALDLVVQPERSFGSLAVSVFDEQGQRLPSFGVELQCLERNLQRNWRRIVPPKDGPLVLKDMRTGRWRLTTYFGKEAMWPVPVHRRGKDVREIVIENDKTTQIRLTAEPAGIVAFRFTGDHPAKGSVWKGLRILARADGSPIPLHPYDPTDMGNRDGRLTVGRLFVADRALAPGRHAFTVFADGYHSRPCEVEVQSDRVATVTVEMFAN